MNACAHVGIIGTVGTGMVSRCAYRGFPGLLAASTEVMLVCIEDPRGAHF